MEKIIKGLEGVVALESRICKIDGEEGQLWYRGYNINDLAKHSTYEEVAYLLIHGSLPKEDQLEEFKEELAENRGISKETRGTIKSLPKKTTPMEALRTAVSSLGSDEPPLTETGKEHNIQVGTELVAKLPTIMAYFHRYQNGKRYVKPKEDLSHAANLLYMLTREEPDEEAERAMDHDLLLHADHALNASTFTARIATSTMSDMYSAVTAAISTLRGPHHGGAAEAARRTVEEIKYPEEAEEYVKEALANHQRIMGFGHRVYKVMDPRARILKKNAEEVSKAGAKKWIEIQEIMQETMEEEKDLYPNVDFYSGTVYNAVGVPMSLYTPMFACGRIAGWVAHCLEQAMDNRLIRPRARFTDTVDKMYVPIEER